MKRLFVGNLPFRANEDELQTWLAEAGVEAGTISIMRDRTSGNSRGFGFIEVGDDAVAEQAILACNGRDFLGRALIVNEARPMTDRPKREAAAAGAFRQGEFNRRDRR